MLALDQYRRGRAYALPFLLTAMICGVCVVLSSCQPLKSTHKTEGVVSVNERRAPNDTKLTSLSELSIETLREKEFSGELTFEASLDQSACVDPEVVKSLPEAEGRYQSYMASYKSEGLRVYSRVNIPDGPAPETGFPVIIFAHGWVGAEAAPDYTLGCDPASMYSEITDAYARAGYLVLIPAYRGHATVNGIVGEGLEFLEDWDNGTYLSTQFYAIDTLNLLAGLHQTDRLQSDDFDIDVPFDPNAVHLAGHSQGGDVVLSVLAAIGEGSGNNLSVKKASIWSGAIAPRLTQMAVYNPLRSSAESFVSGDSQWTGSAKSETGEVNPNFIFGWPPDWIETPEPKAWTWQKETWSFETVREVYEDSLPKTYQKLNEKVEDISGASFELIEDETGKTRIIHDPQIIAGMQGIGGYDFAHYLSEPLILHFPDKDLVSFPDWNFDLCRRVNEAGGQCVSYEYKDNNHGMRLSPHSWFSGPDAVEGYAPMVARDVAFFSGKDSQNVSRE